MVGFGWSFWVLLALLAFFVYCLSNEKERSGVGDPIEILGARYARGEITRNKFLQALRDLMER